jgi:hypothetical protein
VSRGASVSRARGCQKALTLTPCHARLSLVTGGEIASTFERPDLVKLGKCELIEEIMIGEDKVGPVWNPFRY